MDRIKAHRLEASLSSGGTSAKHIYEAFVNLAKRLDLSGDILDFGAGKGNLIPYIQALNRFSSVTAADIMARPAGIDKLVKWISCDLNNAINIANNSFDVIVSLEIIEHLENPRATAREWFRLLRPGGTLLFSMPNNESWRSLLAVVFRGHFTYFADNSYPAHITALLRKDVERIMKEVGFSKVRFVFTDIGVIPKVSKLHWRTISGGLLRGVRYSDNIITIARKLE